MHAYYEEEKIFKSVEGGLKQTQCDLLGRLVHFAWNTKRRGRNMNVWGI